MLGGGGVGEDGSLAQVHDWGWGGLCEVGQLGTDRRRAPGHDWPISPSPIDQTLATS